MKKIVFSILVFGFLTGCNTLKDLANIKKPSVSYSKMVIDDISFKDVTLLFDFEITNPNSFGVSANQYQYEFFINGTKFVSGIQNEDLFIQAESTSIVQVPVSLTFSEVYNTIGSLVRQDSMAYRLSTEVEFNVSGIGAQRVPVSVDGELPVPKLPRIELSSFNVEELSLSGAEMQATFRIENPNAFGITFMNTFYNLEVNGKEWLNTRLEKNVNLGSSESESITVPIRLNSSQMGSVLIEMLNGKQEFEYHLTGSAQVSAELRGFSGLETIPFDVKGIYKLN